MAAENDDSKHSERFQLITSSNEYSQIGRNKERKRVLTPFCHFLIQEVKFPIFLLSIYDKYILAIVPF